MRVVLCQTFRKTQLHLTNLFKFARANLETAVSFLGCQVGCSFHSRETLLKEFCVNRFSLKGLLYW